MNTVVIGVGSNINPENNIRLAKDKISSEVRLIKSSTLVFTKPVGYENQDDFLNGAFLIETEQDKGNLDKILKKIEIELGRKKILNKDGPRTIDLDILLWNNQIIDSDVYSRNYLKESVLELLPDFKF
ncbi:MAG: 2-amino-4-hydroxy-6-hydroxymethyldihydropteridine diphosphokinase [Thermodesulfobacteriota bacterium]